MNTAQASPLVPRIGPWLTAGLGGFWGLGFLLHERPPTAGHLLAASVVLLPALLLLIEMLLASEPSETPWHARRVLAMQAAASGLLAGALASQRVNTGLGWWVGVIAFTGGPLLVSGWELVAVRFQTRRGTPSPRGLAAMPRVAVLRVTGAAWLMAGSASLLLGLNTGAPYRLALAAAQYAVAALNLWSAGRWQRSFVSRA